MPKKVLYLENAIGWGGSAICLKLIAGQLNKNKYYPIITTPHYDSNYKTYKDVAEWHHIPDKRVGKQQIADKINRFFKRIGITNKRCGESIASLFDYIVNLIPYVLKVYCFAKRKQVNIIHLNNEPVCNMGGVIAAKLLKIPCISHVRGPVSWNSSTSRWLYKKVDYFITVAEWVKKDVVKMGISSSKIQTIMDGRKLNEFDRFFNVNKIRSSLGLNGGELSVGMIGRLNPWKGHRVFIEASQAVEKIFPDCRIFIIGGASDKYKEYETELKHLVAEKGIKNLFFTGQRNDIPDVLRVLDVIVHASVEPDPYPNVVLEAMAAGKPVIATNIGGPLEMLEDYKTGMLVPPNKPKILADKICELLSDKSLRQSLGTEAKKIAFERYSIEEHVKNIERVYEKVLPDRIS